MIVHTQNCRLSYHFIIISPIHNGHKDNDVAECSLKSLLSLGPTVIECIVGNLIVVHDDVYMFLVPYILGRALDMVPVNF